MYIGRCFFCETAKGLSDSRGERASGWKPMLYEATKGMAVAGQVVAPSSNLRADIERGRRIAFEEASKWGSARKKPAAWWHEPQPSNDAVKRRAKESHPTNQPPVTSRSTSQACSEAESLAMRYLPTQSPSLEQFKTLQSVVAAPQTAVSASALAADAMEMGSTLTQIDATQRNLQDTHNNAMDVDDSTRSVAGHATRHASPSLVSCDPAAVALRTTAPQPAEQHAVPRKAEELVDGVLLHAHIGAAHQVGIHPVGVDEADSVPGDAQTVQLSDDLAGIYGAAPDLAPDVVLESMEDRPYQVQPAAPVVDKAVWKEQMARGLASWRALTTKRFVVFRPIHVYAQRGCMCSAADREAAATTKQIERTDREKRCRACIQRQLTHRNIKSDGQGYRHRNRHSNRHFFSYDGMS